MATVYQALSTPASRDAGRSASARLAMLDLARLLAAYAIVWIHTPRSAELSHSRELGRFAVPFFVAAAVLFVWDSARRHSERTLTSYASARFVRIYLPFLAWSGIYLVFKAVKAAAAPDLANDFPGWDILWAGGFYHLWFMPFILAVSVLAFAIARAALGRPRLEVTLGIAAALAGIVLAVVPGPECLERVGPWGRLEWNALPAALFGLALAAWCGGRPSAIAQDTRTTSMALLLAGGCLAWSWNSPNAVLAENLSGLCVLIAALASPGSAAPRALETLGGLAFGIYFAHLLFIKTLEAFATKCGWPTNWQLDAAVFLIAAAANTVLSYGLSRSRATRWLVA